jgi:iron complex outermembrane receptor protein
MLLAFTVARSGLAQDRQQAQSAPGTTEVTVSGERAPQRFSARDPSLASTVIDGAELQQAGNTSAQVLARVPGVQVSRGGAEADLATASIRGADSRQTPVYLAGIRLNDDVGGAADLSTIPLWMIQRVEVFRGNAPERADRLGLGGAVFFWPRLPGKPRTGLSAQLGSYGERGVGVAQEAGNDRFATLVSMRHWQANNDYPYLNDFGQRFTGVGVEQRRSNADFTASDAWLIGRYRLGRGAQVVALVNAFQREQGVTGMSVVPAEDSRARAARLLTAVSGRAPCGKQSDDCSIELATSLLKAQTVLSDPDLELPVMATPLLFNQGQRVSQRASVTSKLGDDVTLKVSGNGALETLHIDESSVATRRGQRFSLQLAANADWKLTKQLSLYPLLSVECHRTQASSQDFIGREIQQSDLCASFEPAGRVGGSFEVSDWLSILGNVGRYVRVPTLGELYGVSPQVSGNSNLAAEHGYSVDLGVRGVAPLPAASPVQVRFDAFAFSRWVDDMIRYQRVNTGSLAPFNVASSRVQGIELWTALDWLGHVHAETALTVLDPRETTDDPVADPTQNDILPLTSRFVANSYVEVYLEPEQGALNRAGFGVRHSHRASRYQDPAGLSVLPAQDFFDLEASAQLFAGVLAWRAAVRNLFDQRTVDLIGFPLPGRTFHLVGELWL